VSRAIKLTVLVIVILAVLIGLFGLYVAVVAGANVPGLTGAFRSKGEPASPEVLARAAAVEGKIDDAIEDKSAFYLELTDEEVTALLLSRLDPTAQVRDVKVAIKPEDARVSGSLNGRVGVPFSSAVGVSLESGEVRLLVKSVSVGAVPMPGAVKDEIQPLIDDVLDLNESLRRAGATQIQRLQMEEGKVTIIGVQQGGKTVSNLTKDALQKAYASSGSRPAPVPPGADVVPAGSVGAKAGPELYMALGDSLAANVGATLPQDGYVSRFHSYLERRAGRSLGLMNLGVSGESSITVAKGQLPLALEELRRRRNDGDPNTKVSVLTLDLGANDLLTHLGSEDCQQAPRGEVCQARVEGALDAFEDNFTQIVSSLADALEPNSEFYIMTMYNPFDFGVGIPFEAFSNETVARLNGIIRRAAEAKGARVADPYELMKGNAGVWTHMLDGDIHPNKDGYQVLAWSLAQARNR
jgi:lysophospholipase L1-like esterase